ncbi:response regulator [Petroclostridium sp. X23]|uniref:response regulator n=1 Tax=Petroclostridium sp. X23 TaxID=3045146 RepID=UPI0024ACD38C|nr:response regulator [Petroclostridium sp. X23]WHH59015.1 response regulator [Petroclostridium sp. X23]
MKKNTVLFVDDEINVLNSLKRGLVDEDYRCIFVESGQEALKVIEKEEISVIVTDMRMPGMNGLELLKIVKEKSPQTVRVVLSGYVQLQQILVTLNQADIFKFITKPWKLEEEFKLVINQSIEYYNLQMDSVKLRNALEVRNASYQNILKIMEERLSESKKDFENIKSLYKFSLNKIDEEIRGVNNIDPYILKMREMLKATEKFYIGYLDTLPSELVDFDIRKVSSELESYVKKNNNNIVIINLDKITTGNFHDNYKLLMYILTTLCDYALKGNETCKWACVITSELKESNIKLEFYMSIEYLNAAKYTLNDCFNGLELKNINILFNEICKYLKGNALIEIQENKLFAKIQMHIGKKS